MSNSYYPNNAEVQQMLAAGYVWQPHALGGGEWKQPPIIRLCEADVERIAVAVVRKLKEEQP